MIPARPISQVMETHRSPSGTALRRFVNLSGGLSALIRPLRRIVPILGQGTQLPRPVFGGDLRHNATAHVRHTPPAAPEIDSWAL
jgi:hypothetical protein